MLLIVKDRFNFKYICIWNRGARLPLSYWCLDVDTRSGHWIGKVGYLFMKWDISFHIIKITLYFVQLPVLSFKVHVSELVSSTLYIALCHSHECLCKNLSLRKHNNVCILRSLSEVLATISNCKLFINKSGMEQKIEVWIFYSLQTNENIDYDTHNNT